MAILLRGGTVVTHEMTYKADVLCEDGKITKIKIRINNKQL